MIVTLLGRPGFRPIGILVGVAVLAGLVTIAIIRGWLGAILPGVKLRQQTTEVAA